MLANLCELAAGVLGVPTAVVNLIDDRFQYQVATWGCEPTVCPHEDSRCLLGTLRGEDVAVPDAALDDRFKDSPW